MTTKTWYPAVIDKDPESDYGVSFPDLPGCVSGGATLADAIAAAEEALALHLEGLAAEGQPLPDPSAADGIAEDPAVRRIALVMIPADCPPRSVRVDVTLDEGLLARIDRVAGPRGRSAFLARAASRELGETG